MSLKEFYDASAFICGISAGALMFVAAVLAAYSRSLP